MKKNPEITAKTRQCLVDAFWCFYAKKSIGKISVKEITEKAGYNRSTFYEYFADVPAVLAYVEDSILPTIGDLPPYAVQGDAASLPIDYLVSVYTVHSQYYRVLLGEHGDPSFSARLKQRIKGKLLQMLSPDADIQNVKLDYALEFILSAMIGILTHWFADAERMEQEELLALIAQLTQGDMFRAVKSICNGKGKQP